MPPRARGRGGAGALSRDPAPTLPASIAALPSLVEQLLLAVRSGRQPAASAEDALCRLVQQLLALPDDSPPHAAELAELLSSNPDATAALLRLHAVALRPDGEGISRDRVGTGAGGRGSGGEGGSYGSSAAAWMERWRSLALDAATVPLFICVPLPASRHALCVLRLLRGMLRAQALHALSRNLAAAASALERTGLGASGGAGGSGGTGSGSSGGRVRVSSAAAAAASAVEGARDALTHCLMHVRSSNRLLLDDTTYAGLLFRGEGAAARALPLTGLATEVAAARAAAVEEYARALAESGILEHATRVLLLLQARGPQAALPLGGAPESLPTAVLNLIFHIRWHDSAPGDKLRGVTLPSGFVGACPRAISPTAAALLRSALRGRCVQTAVLVYGVGVLRLTDRGSSYGLPAALQTAGLSLATPSGNARLSALDLLLRQLALPGALRPPSRAASAALALRVGRAAMGTSAWELPPFMTSMTSIPPPPRSAAPLPGGVGVATGLAVASLQTGRRLLPAAGPAAAGPGPAAETAVWSAQRADWWRLAVQMLVYGMNGLLQVEGGLMRQLYDMMAEALVGVWPERRLDLDALPAEAPPEVAAALAGGLLRALTMIGMIVIGSVDPFSRSAITELLAACDKAGSGSGSGLGPGTAAGGGLALVLVPLLAYGERAEADQMLEVLGLLGGLSGPQQARLPQGSLSRQLGGFAVLAGPQHKAAVKQAAAGFLGAAEGALRRCRRLAAAGLKARPTGVLGRSSASDPLAVSYSAASAPAAPAGASNTASAASGVPPPPDLLLRLSHCVAFASELWGLPLP